MSRVARALERTANPEELAEDRRRHQQVRTETSPITGGQPEGKPSKTTRRVHCVVESAGASITFSLDWARFAVRDLPAVGMAEVVEGGQS